jgi:predicted nucleic acid-binding protein
MGGGVKLVRAAVSDTGPLLSVFQSECLDMFRSLYDKIYIPASTLPEYKQHGAGNLIDALIQEGWVIVCALSSSEKETAWALAEEIAAHPSTRNCEPVEHYPEAEAMVLVERQEIEALDLLLDEMAAREVAKAHGLPVVGFAGVLIRACYRGIITAEVVRNLLLTCQSLGTRYAVAFIEGVYQRLKEQEK